jgi:NADPH:quinone reductase-like Zn-dependent oxidoreductase
MAINALALIGKRLTVRGFFAGQFDYATQLLPVIREAAPLVASGALFVPPAVVFDLGDIHAAVQQLDVGGKILLQVSQ